MGAIIFQLIISACAVLATAYLLPSWKVSGFMAAFIAAFVIGLANAVLRPILLFLTLPINILTLGLFTFVVNGIVIKICAALVPGFEVSSWLGAIFGAIILAVINIIFFRVAGIPA